MPKVKSVTLQPIHNSTEVDLPDFNKKQLEDVSFLTAMTLVMMGNYCQTGHFGGPLAYTAYTVASHLAGPEFGGMKYDYRRPKHPFSDKFLLAGGHNAPVTYALWMVLGEALHRQYNLTGDSKYYADPNQTLLSIDCIGFRRSKSGMETILSENDLVDHAVMAQSKIRGIRSLSGHSESTDVTNDVNGGPSGIGVATAAGKAAFWEIMGAGDSGPKIIAVEGEFAMTSGHSQEMKTQALSQQVGKRLRVLLSYNNAGIDDSLVGGVIDSKYEGYRIEDQWASYGWNVFSLDDANNIEDVISTFKAMEEWDPSDRRPMILVGKTVKGWWPAAENGEIPGYGEQITSFKSHPYTFSMNSEYFVSLAKTFERRFGVEFVGIEDGPVTDERERLIQYKTNIDVIMSVLDRTDLGKWLADHLVSIGDQVTDDLNLRINPKEDPFLDSRLDPANLPLESQKVSMSKHTSDESKDLDIKLFEEYGNKRGGRRAISEIVKWMNYVTDNRMVLLAADLAESINVEKGSVWGTFDPVTNPTGIRMKSAIQEAGNVSTAVGLVSQSASLDPDVHSGVWALSGTYGAFTPLMYLPVRVWSQQNQDSPFRVGVLNILAGHSGPETAADARTHFGIFSPQVWKLFPRDQIINLNFWDYNDVAPAYFAAAKIAARDPKVGVIVLECARPDYPVVDRDSLADTDIRAAAKGFYLIRDFDNAKPKQGYVVVQGASATNNLMNIISEINKSGINVRIISAVSEELFRAQSKAYQDSVMPDSAKFNMMIVSTGTKRMWPVSSVGPLTEQYSLVSDWNDSWLSGGSEEEVLQEANLDSETILAAIRKFADDYENRKNMQVNLLEEN